MNWHEEEICKFITNEDLDDNMIEKRRMKGIKQNPHNNNRYCRQYVAINIAWICAVIMYLATAIYFMVR